MKGFIGNGWAHPVSIDAQGSFRRAGETDLIARSIHLILGTARGERMMRPEFGSTLADFVFKPLTAANRGRMATAVKAALQTWEPRIRVLDVAVSVAPDDPAKALISVDYEIRRSNTRANLVYPFYLEGTPR